MKILFGFQGKIKIQINILFNNIRLHQILILLKKVRYIQVIMIKFGI